MHKNEPGQGDRKPGSVPPSNCFDGGGNHSSGPVVTGGLWRVPESFGRATLHPRRARSLFLLLRVGFADHDVTAVARELLPRVFTLTSRLARGGLFSVALSSGSPPLDVIQHPALRSPDFPPAFRPAVSCSPCPDPRTKYSPSLFRARGIVNCGGPIFGVIFRPLNMRAMVGGLDG